MVEDRYHIRHSDDHADQQLIRQLKQMHQDKAENSDDQGIDQFSDNKAGKRFLINWNSATTILAAFSGRTE